MPSASNNWFEKKYVAGAKHVLQDEGWHTRGLFAGPSNVKGNEIEFKIAGKGEASVMSTSVENRPVLNAGRTTVTATMADYEANEWILTTDLEKMSEAEIQVAQKTCGMAIGRKYDKVAFEAMDAGSVLATIGDGSAGFSVVNLVDGQSQIRAQGISGSPKLNVAIPYKWMSELMLIDQFNNADYVGSNPLLKAMGAKSWLGMDIMPFADDNFSVPSANQAYGYMWMSDCVGFHTNYDLVSRVDYVPEKKAHFAGNTMGMCAKTILPEGVIRLHFATNAAFSL